MNTFRTSKRSQASIPFFILSILTGLLFLLTGCGTSTDQPNHTSEPQEKREKKIAESLESVIRPLYELKIAYANTDDQPKPSQLLQRAIERWNKTKSILKQRSNPTRSETIRTNFDQLRSFLEQSVPYARIDAKIDSLLKNLTNLQIRYVSKTRRGTLQSIRHADRDITAEKQINNYRIGVVLKEPSTIYKGKSPESDTDGTTHQLRVVFREEPTKRKLTNSEIFVQFLDNEGEPIKQSDLLETWGPYHFYGRNISVPWNAEQVRVNVTPPLVGRHEDMKDLYLDPAEANFELSGDTGSLEFDAQPSTLVDTGTSLASNVELGYEETLAVKSSGPYRVGFIAEHAEPYWVFRRHNQNKDRPHILRMADVPQSANRHLEIALFEADSYRIIPHADVTLFVSAQKKEARVELKLPFLMSAFNHYGNSLYLPKANYSVEARIGAPKIHTLEPSKFPDLETVNFKWTPEE